MNSILILGILATICLIDGEDRPKYKGMEAVNRMVYTTMHSRKQAIHLKKKLSTPSASVMNDYNNLTTAYIDEEMKKIQIITANYIEYARKNGKRIDCLDLPMEEIRQEGIAARSGGCTENKNSSTLELIATLKSTARLGWCILKEINENVMICGPKPENFNDCIIKKLSNLKESVAELKNTKDFLKKSVDKILTDKTILPIKCVAHDLTEFANKIEQFPSKLAGCMNESLNFNVETWQKS